MAAAPARTAPARTAPTSPVARLLPAAMLGTASAWFCFGFFHRVAPNVMTDVLMADFGIAAAGVGTLAAFYFYAYAALQTPVGVAVDRFGARIPYVLSAATAAAGALIFAAANTPEIAWLGRGLVGAGVAIAWVGALSLAADWFPPHRFALCIGVIQTAGGLGAVFGQAPLGRLVEAVGWRATMSGAAVAALGFAAVFLVLLRLRPPHRASDARGTTAPARRSGAVRAILGRPVTYGLAAAAFAVAAPMLAFSGLWGTPFMMERYALTREEAALTMSATTLTWALSAPVVGWLSDRMGRRKPLIWASLVLSGSALSGVIFVDPLPLAGAVVLMALVGLSLSAIVAVFAMAKELYPADLRATAFGFTNTWVMMAGALLQPAVGVLLDVSWGGATGPDGVPVYGLGDYRIALIVFPVTAAAAMIAFAFVPETRTERPREGPPS